MEIPGAAVAAWRDDGFAVLPGWLDDTALAAAGGELGLLFPSADGFHDGTDERRDRFVDDEFAGIDPFPTASVEVNLVGVHPKVVALAEALLGSDDVRLYSGEAWAKYTGAADYDQPLHPWYAFVERASARQLRLVGFPEPGHPFWTDETLPATQLRYPSFRPEEWRR